LPPHIRESLGIHYNLIDDALFFAQRQTIKTALPIVPRRFSLLPHAYRTLAHQTV